MIIKREDETPIGKNQIEQVQQERHEYNILDSYILSRGMTLYCYNHLDDAVHPVNIFRTDIIELINVKGKLIPLQIEHDKVQVDSRFAYFESLNQKNAEKRVTNFKSGKIKVLNNLRKPGKITIF